MTCQLLLLDSSSEPNGDCSLCINLRVSAVRLKLTELVKAGSKNTGINTVSPVVILY